MKMTRTLRKRKGQLSQVADTLPGDTSQDEDAPAAAITSDEEENHVPVQGEDKMAHGLCPVEQSAIATNVNAKVGSEKATRFKLGRFYGSTQKARPIKVVGDIDEEILAVRRSRRAGMKKKHFGEGDFDDENYHRIKKTRPAVRAAQFDSGSEHWTSEESESGSEYEDALSKKLGKRDAKSKSVPQGERKSERARNVQQKEITDNEFENMLIDKENGIPAYKRKKIEKTKKKKKKSGIKDIRKRKHKEASRQTYEANFEVCVVCQDGGRILLCDECPRSFHMECANLEDVPEGEWSCPRCTGEMSESEDSDTGHDQFCRVCRSGGEVLPCDHCSSVFHLTCLNPQLKDCPEGSWKCPRCVTREKPLKGWVQSVITWKWSSQDEYCDELDHTQSPLKKKSERMRRELAAQRGMEGTLEEQKRPERLLFVRFRDYSYWQSDWITELQLDVFHPHTLIGFKRKFDQDEPPALEDGSSFGEKRHHSGKLEDPHGLEEKFYKWGIKPSWLQIHRILNHDTQGKNNIYLVKWQDLSYEYATWEDPKKVPEGLEGFENHVEEYWTRRNQRMAEEKKGFKGKSNKALLKKKCEVQPSFLDGTGGKLYPYQLEGLNWLRFSFSQDTNTILADEMGLGKTIQAISFLYVLWKEGYSKGPFLVSAPLSTVPNWEREFQFWAPEMYVVSYNGGKEVRQIIRQHEFSYREGAFMTSAPGKFRKSHTPKFDVLLTSYEMVSSDKTTFASIPWDVIVIDEAHRLRSNQSLFFKTLQDYTVKYKLLLTGTPLQNNLEELFNLLNFLEPGKFDDIDNFLEVFSEISKEDQVHRLHEMLAPHMLRRMKADVLKDMPSKSEFIVRVELSPMQKKYYKNILTKNYEALNVKGYGQQTSLLNIMMDLRKCCNHPYLFPAAEMDAPLAKEGNYEVDALTKSCGKLDLLAMMLNVLKEEGHRVLVFSQMTRMLDILEDFLYGMGFGYERIDGSIMGSDRQAAIDRFNSKDSGSFVFLLSTKAGGLGINLATADTVIIFDMDWNPHNDIQAFSRAHRLGQKNKVMIYRFVCRNTVEEKMAQVCKRKMMLTELVIHRNMGAEKADSLSKQEVNDILRFGAEELFKDNAGSKAIVYDDEAVRKLLDRSQESEVGEEQEQEKEFGMNEYLRSFKVASYQVKDGAETDEAPEEDPSLKTPVGDGDYWNRVLGDAYEEHRAQIIKEQEEMAASLGKGKRIRRKINYAERFASPLKKESTVEKEEDEYKPDEEEEYKPGHESSDNDTSDGEDRAESELGIPVDGEAKILERDTADQKKLFEDTTDNKAFFTDTADSRTSFTDTADNKIDKKKQRSRKKKRSFIEGIKEEAIGDGTTLGQSLPDNLDEALSPSTRSTLTERDNSTAGNTDMSIDGRSFNAAKNSGSKLENLLDDIDDLDERLGALEDSFPHLKKVHHKKLNELAEENVKTSLQAGDQEADGQKEKKKRRRRKAVRILPGHDSENSSKEIPLQKVVPMSSDSDSRTITIVDRKPLLESNCGVNHKPSSQIQLNINNNTSPYNSPVRPNQLTKSQYNDGKRNSEHDSSDELPSPSKCMRKLDYSSPDSAEKMRDRLSIVDLPKKAPIKKMIKMGVAALQDLFPLVERRELRRTLEEQEYDLNRADKALQAAAAKRREERNRARMEQGNAAIRVHFRYQINDPGLPILDEQILNLKKLRYMFLEGRTAQQIRDKIKEYQGTTPPWTDEENAAVRKCFRTPIEDPKKPIYLKDTDFCRMFYVCLRRRASGNIRTKVEELRDKAANQAASLVYDKPK